MCLYLGEKGEGDEGEGKTRGRGDKVEEKRISSGSHTPVDKSQVHIQDHPRGWLHKGGACERL